MEQRLQDTLNFLKEIDKGGCKYLVTKKLEKH